MAPAFVSDASVVLGFDYGEKRIGLAVGNTLTGSARPLAIIENRSRDYRFAEIGKVIAEWRPAVLVVGLPFHPDGAAHEMTQLARRFGNQLNGRFNVPVVWVDERYTSVEARQLAREAGQGGGGRGRSGGGAGRGGRGPRIDDAAASLILQQYLNDGGTSQVDLSGQGGA
ncbi:Holliday junction resolvase RuvX [Robbsia sp. KACC 23696]|uniref:Holliday junction resolvase RuvX n=1 Tax=Robbsia sp. KACC 23696 TaxID=3149231 RepID=UPI00325BAB2A